MAFVPGCYFLTFFLAKVMRDMLFLDMIVALHRPIGLEHDSESNDDLQLDYE